MRAFGFAFALTCLAASLASAFPGDGPPPGFEPRPEEMISRHAQELGIDAATIEQIRTLGEQHRAEREVIAAALQEQKRALRTLLESERPDEAEAIALARKIGTLETDLSVARLSAMMRIHALLTPEQNAALHEKMRGRFAERRELLDGATKACAAEIAQHCADESGSPGPPPLMCLLHKRRAEQIEVGAQCDAALREIPPPHFRRYHGPPPGGGPGEQFDVLVPPPGVEPEATE
jgi:Spy/CpxP family protein refolding chaperone